MGGGSAPLIAYKVGADSGKVVQSLWLLTSGRWIYFLPAFPNVNGGLSSFLASPVSAFALLR
jgi:hypothetical protein